MTVPFFGPSHIPPLKIFRSRKASLAAVFLGNGCTTTALPQVKYHVLHIKMYSSPFRITVWKAVDAYWHPLTPEHGFPSLISYKAQGAPPRPAACWRIPFSPFKVWFCYCFFCHLFRKHNDPKFFKSDDIKTGDTHHGMSPVKIHIMTSYGGIIRIRLKGRSLSTSSQPANELPCFL